MTYADEVTLWCSTVSNDNDLIGLDISQVLAWLEIIDASERLDN